MVVIVFCTTCGYLSSNSNLKKKILRSFFFFLFIPLHPHIDEKTQLEFKFPNFLSAVSVQNNTRLFFDFVCYYSMHRVCNVLAYNIAVLFTHWEEKKKNLHSRVK